MTCDCSFEYMRPDDDHSTAVWQHTARCFSAVCLGHCVAPATTAPMSTTTVTKTTTVKTTTATEPSTETTAEPTTEPATTTTVGDPTTEATTAEPTTTTAMAEPTTTTGDPTTASASTTTTTPGPCPGCPGAPYFCCLNKACRIRPALGQGTYALCFGGWGRGGTVVWMVVCVCVFVCVCVCVRACVCVYVQNKMFSFKMLFRKVQTLISYDIHNLHIFGVIPFIKLQNDT